MTKRSRRRHRHKKSGTPGIVLDVLGAHIYALYFSARVIAEVTGNDSEAIALEMLQAGVTAVHNATPEKLQKVCDKTISMLRA